MLFCVLLSVYPFGSSSERLTARILSLEKQTCHRAVPEFQKGWAVTINLLQRSRSITVLKEVTSEHFQPLPTTSDLFRALPSLGEKSRRKQGKYWTISFEIKTNLQLTINLFRQILSQFKPGWALACFNQKYFKCWLFSGAHFWDLSLMFTIVQRCN